MYDLTAMGELLIDFTQLSTDGEGYPTLAAHPGGAPGNFLAALCRYGSSAAFLGKVGDDAFGRLLVDTLARAGIETRGIRVDPTVFTTLAFVTLVDGERSFSFARKPGADTLLRFDELELSLIDQSRAFHFGALSLTDEPTPGRRESSSPLTQTTVRPCGGARPRPERKRSGAWSRPTWSNSVTRSCPSSGAVRRRRGPAACGRSVVWLWL